MQQISNLPVFTGTIPNKATQNDTDFANNIFGFLNYSGNSFARDFNVIVDEFNTLSDEIQTAAQSASTNAEQAKTARDQAVGALATLTAGAIDNTNKANNKAYSNIKVDELLHPGTEKLSGIEDNANNYTHPLSHTADMITESLSRKFVTPAEKNSWNENRTPTGTIIAFASNTPPEGYLKANGALLSRTTYAALFAAIGTTFGAGDGITTFALPDLRGYFPRGWDDGRGIDTSRVFGSLQNDGYLNHSHTASSGSSSHSHTGYAANGSGALVGIQRAYINYANTTSLEDSGAHTHNITVNVSTTGGTETRPKNIALLYCIKY